MTGKHRLLSLAAISTVVSIVIVSVAMALLYNSAFEQQRASLINIVKSQASLIKAIARYDQKATEQFLVESPDYDAFEATLSKLQEAHTIYEGIDEIVEFVLARRQGDQIVFLLNHLHHDPQPDSISYSSPTAEPMRRALKGESGTVVGFDYQGETVLAAYEQVNELNLGIVAKIDLAKIRAPFIRAGLILAGIAIVLILFGFALFFHIGNPMVRDLIEKEELLRTSISQMPIAYILWDTNQKVLEWNKAAEEIFGYSSEEVIGETIFELIVPASAKGQVDIVLNELISGIPSSYSAKDNNIRKDGTLISCHWHNSPIVDANGEVTAILSMAEDVTEQIRAEEELQRYETIVSNSNDMLALMDKNFVYLAVNERYAAAFGKTRGELVGHAVSVIFGDTYIKTVIRPNAERCLKGHEVRHQNWVDFPTLGKRFMEVHYTPYSERGNEISGFIINGRDITEHKEAEDSLRESEENFRTLIENTSIIPWKFDLRKNKFTFMGKQAEKILGYPVESWTDIDSWSSRIHPDDRTAAMAFCMTSTERGDDHDFEYRCLTASGDIVWLRDLVTLRKDDKGVPFELIGHMVDITKRKRAEEANARLSRAIEQADETIVITDTEGTIQYVNPAFEKMTGYTKEEAIGNNPRMLQSGQQDDAFYERMWATLSSGKEWRGEIINRKKNGTLFTEHAVISPVIDSQGVIINYVAAKNDISEMKRLQELESRAARLETAGIIAGQVAHDFNNLLAPIMAYPEFIHDAIPKDHKAHRYLDVIENSASRIAEINQDLLTMGRRGHYNLEIIDLNLIVRQAVQEMSSGIEEIAFEMNLCDNLLKMRGGAAQIHRVLSNLIVNALDAMRYVGKVTVKNENYYADYTSVTFDRIPRGEYVKLTISDNGCGIPDKIVNKILDPFFSTKAADQKRGSGLGLSVVDAVMKDHNGFLDLSSKVGEGTSFYLYFPVCKEKAKEDDSECYIGGSEKVLVVDDDEIQRDVSSLLLAKIGYEVSSVESGEKAIEFLKEDPRELIILDMVMPGGMDGAETYRRILEINPHQKAIILSGFSGTDRVVEAQNLGAGAFVQKPVTKHDIAAAVRTELDRQVEAVIAT